MKIVCTRSSSTVLWTQKNASACEYVYVYMNHPPVAIDYTYILGEDTDILIILPCFDQDGDFTTARITKGPDRGVLYDVNNPVPLFPFEEIPGTRSTRVYPTVVLQEAEAKNLLRLAFFYGANLTTNSTVENLGRYVIFSPAEEDSSVPYTEFSYQCGDPSGLWSNEATLTMEVYPQNDRPDTEDMTFENVPEDTNVVITFSGNDVDNSPEDLIFIIMDVPETGTLYTSSNCSTPESPITSHFNRVELVQYVVDVGETTTRIPNNIIGMPDCYPTWGTCAGGTDVFPGDHVEVIFGESFYATAIAAYETAAPGFISKIELWNPDVGEYVTVHEGQDVAPATEVRRYSPPICPTDFLTNKARLSFSATNSSAGGTIDAVEMVGSYSLPGNMLKNKCVVYVPEENSYGNFTFTYVASDCQDESRDSVVLMQFSEVNDPPDASRFSVSFTESLDTSLLVNLPAQDVETSESELLYTVSRLPAIGQWSDSLGELPVRPGECQCLFACESPESQSVCDVNVCDTPTCTTSDEAECTCEPFSSTETCSDGTTCSGGTSCLCVDKLTVIPPLYLVPDLAGADCLDLDGEIHFSVTDADGATDSSVVRVKCDKGCVPGRYFDGNGACAVCPMGTYSNRYNVSSCTGCSETTYQGRTGSTQCESCPARTNRNATSSGYTVDECLCKEGAWMGMDMTIGGACEDCPTGGVCDGGVVIPRPSKDFWGDPSHPTEFLECPPLQCDGNYTCAEGREGTLCSKCMDDYHSIGGTCYKCTEPYAVSTIIGTAIVIFLWYLINSVLSGQSMTMDLLLMYLQIVAMVSTFGLRWADEVVPLLSLIAVVNFDVDFFSPKCWVTSWSPASSIIVQLLLPAILFGIVVLRLFIKGVRQYGWSVALRRYFLSRSALRHTCLHTSVIGPTLYFIDCQYHTLTIKSLATFVCMELPDGTSVLSWVPSVECGTTGHAGLVLLGVFGVVCYTILVPVVFAGVLLHGLRHQLFGTTWFEERFGFMYTAYEPGFFYWHLVRLARRFGFCVTMVCFNEEPIGQSALALVIMVATLSSNVFAMPYVRNYLDNLDTVLAISQLFFLYCGVLFYTEVFTTGATILVLLVLVGTILICGVVGFVETHFMRRQRQSRDVLDPGKRKQKRDSVLPGLAELGGVVGGKLGKLAGQ
eukprot:Rmarinus@m.27236